MRSLEFDFAIRRPRRPSVMSCPLPTLLTDGIETHPRARFMPRTWGIHMRVERVVVRSAETLRILCLSLVFSLGALSAPKVSPEVQAALDALPKVEEVVTSKSGKVIMLSGQLGKDFLEV